MLDWLSLFLRRPCFQLQTWLFIPFNFVIVFYRLVIGEALVSRLVLHLFDTSSLFSWAVVSSTAPQLSFSILVTKTERYWCWTDWVFFWERHDFSYKHGCLIHSTLSFMFFYRLVLDEALVSRLVLHLLDNSSHFSWAIVCSTAPQLRFSTLVTKTVRYCCWTDWVFFWEDHAFSYKHDCLIPSTFSLMFFYRLVFNGAVVIPVVLHLVDFFWGHHYV